jgi:hypothetical protein
MSHEHELGKYERNGNRADLERLLVMGKKHQADVDWKPKQPEKNSGVPVKKEEKPEAKAEKAETEKPTPPESKSEAKAEPEAIEKPEEGTSA